MATVCIVLIITPFPCPLPFPSPFLFLVPDSLFLLWFLRFVFPRSCFFFSCCFTIILSYRSVYLCLPCSFCPFSFPFSFNFILSIVTVFLFFVTLFLFFSFFCCPLCLVPCVLVPANQQVSFGACRSTRHVAENDCKVVQCSFQLTQTAFSIVLNSPS